MTSIAPETKTEGQIIHEILLGYFAERGRREWLVPRFSQDPEKDAHSSSCSRRSFCPPSSGLETGCLSAVCASSLVGAKPGWVACDCSLCRAGWAQQEHEWGRRLSAAHVPLRFSTAAKTSWVLWHCFHLSYVSSLLKLYLDKYMKSQQMAKSETFSPTL